MKKFVVLFFSLVFMLSMTANVFADEPATKWFKKKPDNFKSCVEISENNEKMTFEYRTDLDARAYNAYNINRFTEMIERRWEEGKISDEEKEKMLEQYKKDSMNYIPSGHYYGTVKE